VTQATAAEAADVVKAARSTFVTGRTTDRQWRETQLRRLISFLDSCEPEIAAALASDLGRDRTETFLLDLAPARADARYALKHLSRWMRSRRRPAPWRHLPGWTQVRYEPLGVVLIIGPWNAPVTLVLAPLVAALAAGNCVVLKPSELAPATASLLSRRLPEYLDPEAVFVVEGDHRVTEGLLSEDIDHVFFTGGTETGRKVMARAAEHLTPVTLELGGKSPVIVAADADLDVTARRIAWIKLMNAGQLCIAPDYVLADETIRDALVERIVMTFAQFISAADGLRIVNERHFERIAGLLDLTDGRLACGGGRRPRQLAIEPTIVVDPDPHEPLMREEIFGPVLPILPYRRLDEAIAFINARPKPLAAYVFTRSAVVRQQAISAISAGAVVVNHVGTHVLVHALPFGGVGASGTGAYHGRWGFETMSHRKAVLERTFHPDPRVVYPPYRGWKRRALRWLF